MKFPRYARFYRHCATATWSWDCLGLGKYSAFSASDIPCRSILYRREKKIYNFKTSTLIEMSPFYLWVLICCFILYLWINLRVQYGHLCGLSPLWIFRWRYSELGSANFLPQISHVTAGLPFAAATVAAAVRLSPTLFPDPEMAEFWFLPLGLPELFSQL